MTGVEHAAAVECRAAGRTLTGVGMRYGDTAPGFRETFLPGGLVGLADPFPLVMQHDTSLVIATTDGALHVTDGPTAFEARAELEPDSAALVLVRSGSLTGMSVGFVSHREHHDRTGLRVIEEYTYEHLGLVDRPAFPASTVEVRARWGAATRMARMSSFVPGGKRLACSCSGPQASWAEFTTEALQGVAADVANGRNVMAGFGTFDRPLGNADSGTVRVAMSKRGLEVEIDIPDSEVGHAVREAAGTTGLVVRPHIDAKDRPGNTEIDGDTMRYTGEAKVRGFIVSAAGAGRSEGWPEPIIDAIEDVAEPRAAPDRRRMLAWL